MKRRHFVWFSLLFVAGCSAATTSSNLSENTLSQPEVIRFAVTDVKGLASLEENYGTFRDILAETLNIKVEFFPVEDFVNAAAALELNQVDLVLAGPSEYVVINARTNALPVVALTRPNYRSAIAVRADSGIQSVADLKGKTIAVSNLGSTASHLGTIKLVIDAGLNPVSDVQFSILDDPTNGKQGLTALKSGEVDAWGVVIYRYEKYLEEQNLSKTDFPVLATGDPLPNDVFVANSRLDPAFINTMRDRILKNQTQLMKGIVAAESKFKGGELVPTHDSDYDMIRQVYKALGQNEAIQ